MSPSPDRQPAVDAVDLRKRFGHITALDGVAFRVHHGESVSLFGPNGAGKTTLLRTLLGFYDASAGSARVLGHDLATAIKPIRSLIGYMPESDAFIANLTAVRFVRFMAELSGLPAEAAS